MTLAQVYANVLVKWSTSSFLNFTHLTNACSRFMKPFGVNIMWSLLNLECDCSDIKRCFNAITFFRLHYRSHLEYYQCRYNYKIMHVRSNLKPCIIIQIIRRTALFFNIVSDISTKKSSFLYYFIYCSYTV